MYILLNMFQMQNNPFVFVVPYRTLPILIHLESEIHLVSRWVFTQKVQNYTSFMTHFLVVQRLKIFMRRCTRARKYPYLHHWRLHYAKVRPCIRGIWAWPVVIAIHSRYGHPILINKHMFSVMIIIFTGYPSSAEWQWLWRIHVSICQVALFHAAIEVLFPYPIPTTRHAQIEKSNVGWIKKGYCTKLIVHNIYYFYFKCVYTYNQQVQSAVIYF